MEFIPKNILMEFHTDTLEEVRKSVDLHRPGEMKRAVDILEERVKQQSHFTKKVFNRHYLESIIIGNKGSIERAKVNLDKMCTFRTLLPKYFGDYDLRTDFPELDGILKIGVLPKLTKDHYRVIIQANLGEKFYPTLALHMGRIIFQHTEYIKAHDYCKGYIIIIDLKKANMRETLGAMSISDAGEIVSILIGGYDTRIKGIHLLTASKLADILLTMFKPFLSAKIYDRLKVHKTFEGLHEFIPKSILPTEYGGEEKSRNILHDEFNDVLCSKEFKEYHRDILNARTDESLRPTDTFNDTYMGVAGTFRTLNVD